VILSPTILTLFTLNLVFLIFGLIAFFLSIRITKKWDLNSTSNIQYKLEKQTYLAATIIKYIFLLKIPLFLFFIFTLDNISASIIGAMCAAGVVDATPYGIYLFIFKIINIYLFGYWLLLHYKDISNEHFLYTKKKFLLFIIAFIFLVIEILLETLMFLSIDLDQIVSCCGTLYSSTSNSYISNLFLIQPVFQVITFYTLAFFLFVSYLFKKEHLFIITNFLFLLISIITLISFFGTYIYELPTHHCPFCFLQSDYNYIGYLLYSFLFFGTFFGIGIKLFTNGFNLSMIFNSLYLFTITYYPLSYYLKNGVWL
jgi:hypothetical protein